MCERTLGCRLKLALEKEQQTAPRELRLLADSLVPDNLDLPELPLAWDMPEHQSEAL
jgi:hypothetical protein